MYCPECGTRNDDNSPRCIKCGKVFKQNAIGPKRRVVHGEYVPNYLAQAILATLFCCLPFGIVAIVYAAQVNGKLASGDIDGAMRASKRARVWCWVTFGLGIIPVLVSISIIGMSLYYGSANIPLFYMFR